MVEVLSHGIELSELSEAERRQLFAQLSAEFNTSGSRGLREPDNFSYAEQATWDALCELTHTRVPLRRHVQQSKSGRNRYSEQINGLEAYIDRACGALHRTQRDAIRQTLLGCLIRHITQRNAYTENPVPLIPSRVIGLLSWLPSAVESDFPGYAAAGLLHRVVASLAA